MLMFALLRMKMKNVFNLFVSCGLLFGSILLSIVVQEYFNPQKVHVFLNMKKTLPFYYQQNTFYSPN